MAVARLVHGSLEGHAGMRHVYEPRYVPGRAVAGIRYTDSRGRQAWVLVDRNTLPKPSGRSSDVEGPPPVSAYVYDDELVPVNTTVRPEPAEVWIVYPLLSSCPFSMTRTAPDPEVFMVTLLVSCTSPHMIWLPLQL